MGSYLNPGIEEFQECLNSKKYIDMNFINMIQTETYEALKIYIQMNMNGLKTSVLKSRDLLVTLMH